jgi:hypothetical protein
VLQFLRSLYRRKGVINVFSTARLNVKAKHLHQLHNIYSCNTFFTKCVATHFVKEISGGD